MLTPAVTRKAVGERGCGAGSGQWELRHCPGVVSWLYGNEGEKCSVEWVLSGTQGSDRA